MRPIQGEHLIIDLINMNRDICLNGRKWVQVFEEIALSLELKILNTHIHDFIPPAAPGFTAYILLDSSHFSVHTYADNGAIAVDLFSCGGQKLNDAFVSLCSCFNIVEKNIKKKSIITRF